MAKLNPDDFTPEDIRPLFIFCPKWAARLLCEMAVIDGYFIRIKPGHYKILTSNNEE
jgi:hypothetical protein